MCPSFTLTDQVDSMQVVNMTSARMSFRVAWESGESAPSDWFGEGDRRSIAFGPPGIPLGSECVALVEFEDVPAQRVQPPLYYASAANLAGTYLVAGDPGALDVEYLGAQPSSP